MLTKKEIFEIKTQLLCKGVNLYEEFIETYSAKGITFEEGRKGGAGPLGGRYFIFDDDITFVNLPLWHKSKHTNLILKCDNEGLFEIYNTEEKITLANLKIVPNPEFYNKSTSDGMPMKKIALMHGTDCLATTIYQRCCYWKTGNQCQFCGIELSLESGDTIEEKTPQQLIEVIEAARQEDRCNHLTLTTGSTEAPDKGVLKYLDIVKEIKHKYPSLPIHVQIEAVNGLTNIDLLKKAGADTIGIHIEILDDFIRKIICPGKSTTSLETYENNWKHAVKVFGRDQVSSYVLVGFGESVEDLLEDLEKIVKLGVIPYVTPARPDPQQTKNMPIMNYLMLMHVYSHTAKLMIKYDVNPLNSRAGCVRCGGCSAISEAYRLQI